MQKMVLVVNSYCPINVVGKSRGTVTGGVVKLPVKGPTTVSVQANTCEPIVILICGKMVPDTSYVTPPMKPGLSRVVFSVTVSRGQESFICLDVTEQANESRPRLCAMGCKTLMA